MAEVHGRNSPTAVDAGPADVTKPPDCHICDNVTATAYCTVCKIHLCTRCVHNHEKVPVTKAHKLLMGSAMPLLTDSSVIDTAFDQPEHCPDHQKEEIKFFCTKHTNLCCVACTVVKHRSCKIEYIPDVSKDFASSEEYMKLVERIKDIERLLAQCQADIHRCHDAVDRMSKYEIGIFRSFKAEIIAFLDKRESQLLTEIQRRRDEDNIILQNLKTRSELMNTATEEMKRKLRGIESNPERLFIMTKRFQYQVASLQTAVEEIQKKTGYRKYEVQKDASVEAVLNSATGVATVEDELDFSRVKLQRDQDITAGKPNDIAVVSPTELLVCDYGSMTVYLVDSIVGVIVTKISTPESPIKICVLREGISAVTLEGKKVLFLKVGRGSLTLDTVMEFDNNVYGIASLNNNLVVSCVSPSRVEMMTMEGEIICTVDNEEAGRMVSHNPVLLTNSKDGHIFVSDLKSNTVTKLDNKLVVMRRYTDPNLQLICGIKSISRDQLLVCCQNNHRIVMLNTRTGNTTVLLGKQDGLSYPYALTYCHTQRKLFVVSGVLSKIQAYKIVNAIAIARN